MYKNNNDYVVNMIGDKCQVQQSKLMSFIDVVGDTDKRDKGNCEEQYNYMDLGI